MSQAFPEMSSAPAGRAAASPAPAGMPDKSLPYYEKIRKELRDMIQRKRQLDKSLALYEENIARCETTYLEDTQNGNIVKGFDNYIKGAASRRRNNINDSDRIFSLSSLTYASKLKQQEDTTPVTNNSTPTASENLPRINTTGRKQKKRRKGEDESDSPSEVETPGPKRVRISFSGQSTS